MRIAVALSGGIDSTSALLRLKLNGHDVIAITMKNYAKEHSKCSLLTNGISDAKDICSQFNIKHYIIDTQELFKQKVIDYFVKQYLDAKTPNACLTCNAFVKFNSISSFASSLGYNYIATGHYAVIENNKSNVTVLKKGIDSSKDQSYFLSRLDKATLKHCLFPLGKTTKKQNVEFLKSLDIHHIANKKESQEMCFVHKDSYKDFIKHYDPNSNIKPGNIIDQHNNVLGTHDGIPFYTIGQRKGLNVAIGKPAYVTHINPVTNNITIGDKPFHSNLNMSSLNWLLDLSPQDIRSTTFNVKVRYMHKGQDATFANFNNYSTATLAFKEQVLAITPGQGAVGYINDKVAFSGIIDNPF